MSLKILLVGPENSGKSASFRNMPPKETAIISPDKKELPWLGWEKDWKVKRRDHKGNEVGVSAKEANYFWENEPAKVMKAIDYIDEKRPEIKYLVIDTVTSMSTWEVFERATEKGYDKWSQIAGNLMGIFFRIDNVRTDLTTVMVMHADVEYDSLGDTQTTIFYPGGKMVKEKGKPQVKYSVIVETKKIADEDGEGRPEYKFKLADSGHDLARLPMGVTDDMYMENDLYKLINMLNQKINPK